MILTVPLLLSDGVAISMYVPASSMYVHTNIYNTPTCDYIYIVHTYTHTHTHTYIYTHVYIVKCITTLHSIKNVAYSWECCIVENIGKDSKRLFLSYYSVDPHKIFHEKSTFIFLFKIPTVHYKLGNLFSFMITTSTKTIPAPGLMRYTQWSNSMGELRSFKQLPCRCCHGCFPGCI